MKRIFPSLLIAFILFSVSVMPAAAELVSGKASLAGPAALSINGRIVKLDDVRMPGPGATCSEWRGQHQVKFTCNEQADASLKSLVADNTVACAVGAGGFGTCYVDGLDIAQRLVEAGWATSCGQTTRYVDIEQAARQARRGMWTGNFTLDTQCPAQTP